MISQTRQRFAMGAMVVAAILALAVGAVYQDDDRLDEARVVGAGPSNNAAASAGAAGDGEGEAADAAPAADGPIEGFLPRSGEASACREDVGVDLIPGYGAELTINGIEIPPEGMNVNLDDEGQITNVITASRSLGHYTFKPDDTCPNGTFLRPLNNVLQVCVYRLSDAERRCVRQVERTFDAL